MSGYESAASLDPRFYVELVESAPDATLLIDSSGRILLASAQTRCLFGYSPAELLGQGVEILIPERFRLRHSIHREAYFRQPKVRQMGAGAELQGRRKDGSEFPVEIGLSPLHVEGTLYAAAALRDATMRHKAQDKFRALLESAPDAMVIIDHSGRITLVNAQTERMFGYRRETLVGKTVEALVPERYRGAHLQHRLNYFKDPKVRPMGAGIELQGRRRDGSEFHIEISLSPLETEEGTWATAAIRDATERKRAAAQLERSNRDLEQFAYIASHDLQAPLRSIAGFSQLLQEKFKGRLGADADEYLKHIERSSAHMHGLIQGLLAFSRVGRQESKLEPVEAEKPLLQALSQLRAVIGERKANIVHGRLPRVLGNELELAQLFQNLIGNAIKFQPASEPAVTVSVCRDAEFWRFSVTDRGIGMEAQHLDKLFKMFHRLHTREEFEGTGIGLAICQKIVHRHGGRIWAESQPGKGSSFYFTLRPNE